MSPERDPLEERLREALEARAEEARPRGDGLSRIRSRVERRKRLPFLAHPALAAAGSAGVLVIAVSAAAAGVGKIPGTPPWAQSGAQSSASTAHHGNATSHSSSTKPTASTKKPTPHVSHKSPTGPKPTGGTVTTAKQKKQVSVPVYYLAKSGSNWSLQKTDQSVTLDRKPSQSDRAEAAIDAMLDDTGPYASPWQPGTTVQDTSISGSTLQVDLSASAASGTVNDGAAAQAALQQLVYTATAAAPSTTSVRLTIGGQPTSRFWGFVPVSSSVSRSDPGLTQPLNAISAPSADATVSSPVTISGSGSYAQSSADWQVLQSGMVVKSGSASTGTTGFATWSTTVDLDPGTYKLRTYDGSTGGDQNAQTVRFTVAPTPSSTTPS